MTPWHMPSRAVEDQPPVVGDWPGPIHGELGVLAGDGQRVQCHVCGRWFKSLAAHASMLHGLSPDEYRATFGLRARTALVGQALSELRRKLAAPRLRAWQPLHAHLITDQTWEERSQRRRTAVLALESRRDPKNVQRWRELSMRAQDKRRVLFTDPEYRARVGEHISQGKGGRVQVNCTICDQTMLVKRSAANDFAHHLCSDPCIAEFRRRWASQLSGLPRHRKVELTCQACGKSFAGRRGQRFCSKRCNDYAKKHRFAGGVSDVRAAFPGLPRPAVLLAWLCGPYAVVATRES